MLRFASIGLLAMLASSGTRPVVMVDLRLRGDAVVGHEQLSLAAPIYALSWSRDGSRLAVLNSNDLSIFDATTWSRLSRQIVKSRLYLGKSIAFISENHVIVGGDIAGSASGGRHALTIWKLGEQRPEGFLPSGDGDSVSYKPQETFRLSPDTTRLASTDIEGYSLFLYDLMSHELLWKRELPKGTRPVQDPPEAYSTHAGIDDRFAAFAFAPDGESLAACTSLGRLFFVDVRTGSLTERVSPFPNGVRCAALGFSPDGRYLAVARNAASPVSSAVSAVPDRLAPSRNGKAELKVLGSDGEVVLSTREVETRTVRDLAWALQGTEVAVADDDGVEVLQVTTSGELRPSRRYAGAATAVAYSSQGLLGIIQTDGLYIYNRN